MGTDHKFWPTTNELHASILKEYSNTFRCIDQSELSFWGTLDTSNAQVISIDLVKCVGDEVVCKSEEEVKQYFGYREMLILSN